MPSLSLPSSPEGAVHPSGYSSLSYGCRGIYVHNFHLMGIYCLNAQPSMCTEMRIIQVFVLNRVSAEEHAFLLNTWRTDKGTI